MSKISFHRETGLPFEDEGAGIPKPGSDFGTKTPDDFQLGKSFGSGHQSPIADYTTVVAAGAAGILNGD